MCFRAQRAIMGDPAYTSGSHHDLERFIYTCSRLLYHNIDRTITGLSAIACLSYRVVSVSASTLKHQGPKRQAMPLLNPVQKRIKSLRLCIITFHRNRAAKDGAAKEK